ncbi:hypothetical protein ACVWZW_002480 [Bradyrhizobium sp. F1.13.4]
MPKHAGEAADGVAVLGQIGRLEQVLADLRPRRARHLFDADNEDNPGRAGRDRAHALMDGGGAGGAGVLDPGRRLEAQLRVGLKHQ